MPISTPADPALARIAARLEQLADFARKVATVDDRLWLQRQIEAAAAVVA